MKINKDDLKKLVDRGIPIKKRHILNLEKYTYWYNKVSDYTDAMLTYQNDRDKYLENFRQSLLGSFEMNEHQLIQRKEFIMLYTLLKYHNAMNPKNKIYMSEKGRRVKAHDRRAVRDSSFK